MSPGRPGASRDVVAVSAALIVFVIVSRAAFVSEAIDVNRDGPRYVDALALDAAYDIPAPGKLGFILLAILARHVAPTPSAAFGAVTMGLSAIAAVFIYLFIRLYVPWRLAGATTLAVLSGPIAWFYGSVIASYAVWLASVPAIAYFCVRYLREGRPWLAVAAGGATGVASILRPDMLAFAGPMLAAALWLRRAPLRISAAVAGICGIATIVWFFGTAQLSGGVTAYLELIREQRHYHYELGIGDGHPFAAVMRNGVKYVMFLGWDALLLIVPAVFFLMRRGRSALRRWREMVFVAAWQAPTLAFGLLMVMCTGGLIFAALPLLGVAAAAGTFDLFGRREGPAAAALLAAAALTVWQFLAAPLVPSDTQRNVIVNVMLTKQAGPAIRARYYYNLLDFQIDSSLAHVLHELRANDPVPAFPADFQGAR